MISGAHSVLFSRDAAATRRFISEVLELPSVDAGGGWLIFALPPAEVAVHPSEGSGTHELFLMCDDIAEAIQRLAEKGVETGPIEEEPWGLLTRIDVPGFGPLGIYQPRHDRP